MLGDRLGPKLVDLMVQGTLAARRGLAPHEAKVHQAAMQAVIDRAGREVAGLYAPLIGPYLASDDAHPVVRDHLARAASGTHQWEALVGFGVGASGAPSALSTIFSNELAPLVYATVETNPHLIPDVTTIAGLAARGLVGNDEAVHSGRQLGYTPGWTQRLIEATQTVPGIDQLFQMFNLGYLDSQQLGAWLRRAGIPAQLLPPLENLARTWLSPEAAALAVLRGEINEGQAQQYADAAGITNEDFSVLIANSGEPLGLMQLLEAYRRGIIDKPKLVKGIRQSRVRDEWTATALALRYQPIGTADAIDAYQRGRIDRATAYAIAEHNGVEPDQIPILVANAGNPPAPEQLLELWRRGKVTEHQVREGLLQGRTKDDWIPQILELKYQRMDTSNAIDAWLRGHITEAEAAKIAEENGLVASDVPGLLANAGNPLALEQLLEAWRRGFIDEARVKQGIRESRTRTDWTDTALKLRYRRMSTADAVTASVQGQISVVRAKEIATQNGLDPADFQGLWDAAGSPLARTELQQLFNRRLITMAQYKQGLRESRMKDKYTDLATDLHVRLPEPRQVTAALADGIITAADASRMLAEEGYSPSVIEMLVKLGTVRSTGPYRQLMTGEVSTLYADHVIDQVTATSMLAKLHYQPDTITLILSLADYKRDQGIRKAGITAIRSHYLAYRSEDIEAKADLMALGYGSDTADLYLSTWALERKDKTRGLTEAQIVAAVKKNLFVPQEKLTSEQWADRNHDAGHERLVQLGYSPEDADLLLAGA